MAVKYRIEYCNKSSDTARLDIDVRGYSDQVYPIEGTGDLFLLEYKRTDDYILSTVADIQIFSDENFNIDLLKTSDETELKALFYVNNVLKWQGYILPDFFQTGIVGNEAVSMTATDRISVLKDVAMDYSLEKISYAQLIANCLEKTGLSMNFNVVADFMLDGVPSTFHIMNCYVDHARITNRNKTLSAYDTLRSVLVMLNAQIVQWAGEWWIVNRYQLRNGGGRVYNYTTSGIFNTSGTFTPTSIPFGFVEAGGRRSIEPVASQTSVFMEFGGVRRYPEDYEFRTYSSGYAGWTEVNGFTCTVSSKEVLGYTAGYVAIEGTRDVRSRMVHANAAPTFYDKAVVLNDAPYLKSTPFVNKIEGAINVDVQINATGINGGGMPFIILIDNKRTDDSKERYYCYGVNGIEKMPASNVTADVRRSCVNNINFYDENLPATAAISASSKLNFTLNPIDVGVAEIAGVEFSILLYGTSISGTIKTYVEEASIGISTVNNGKGILYRTDQGAGNYSKKADADTTIFGDHLTQGINGFFYAYPQDELSIHTYLGYNIRTGWVSPDDTQVDPLLLHSVRQRARINSKAKNILNVDFSATFNPLAVYTCNGVSYVVRSARHDFLRTRTSVELEENASQSLTKIDYIYTYFGDEKEKGITTLSGISGSGSSGGTASHTHNNKDIIDQLSQVNLDVLALLEIDENDNLKVNANLYSTGEVSAYGIGSTGGGGGGSTVAWGTESAGSVPLTVEGISKTLSLASHTHSGYLTSESDPTVPSWVKAITSSDITNWNAYGSQVHSHLNKSIIDAITAAYTTEEKTKLSGIAAGAEVNVQSDWNATSGDAFILNKPTTLAGYGILSTDTLFNNKYEPKNSNIQTHISATNNPHNVTKTQVGLGNVLNVDSYSKSESDSLLNLKLNKSIFDDLFEKVEISTGVWAIKAKYHFYGVGEVSAYGFGETGGGTGGALSDLSDVIIPNRTTGDLLVYNGTHWVNQPQSSIIPNLTGYATESWSNNRFALKSHSHIIGDVTGLQSALDGKFNNPNGNTSQYIRGDGSIVNFPSIPQGTVTSVALTTPTGLTVTGSPITTSGTLVLGLQSGYSIPTTAKQNNWDIAYTHSQSEHQAIINGTGFVKANGKTLSYDNNSYSLSSHNHSGIYEPVFTKNTAFNKNFGTTAGTVAEGNHTHTFASLTSKPTTLSGYGITDAMLASAYTAADVLTKLKTVDGHTSGLDADTVDGKHVTTSGWWDKLVYIGADGVMEVGAHIDFHELSSGGPDYAGRLSCYSGSPLWSGSAMYYALNANRTDVNWAASTLTAQTDILTPFNTWSYNGWTYPTDKNSLNKFLKLFDIDTAGNLVVKTNLYSTGEVSAYKSGTGVSGLTLMGDMNANGKNINNLTSISNLGSKIRLLGSSIAFDIEGYDNQLIIADDGMYANTNIEASSFFASGIVQAPEFKFGNWSFKEVSGNMVIYYNGTAKATIQSSRTNSNL